MAFPEAGHVPPSLQAQRGFLMLEIMLALILMAVVAVGVQRSAARATAIEFARAEADALETVRRALSHYIFDHYVALQNHREVRRIRPSDDAVVVLPDGRAPGQSHRPTVSDLRAMEYLPAEFGDRALLNGGSYRAEIWHGVAPDDPSPCSGPSCPINGMVWIDQPFVAGSSTDPDGLTVGTVMQRVGGNSAASLLTAPAVLTGYGDKFTLPNRVGGQPAGVIGARVGFGAETFGDYVRMEDPRDVRLNATLSVQGSTTLTGAVTVVAGLAAGGRITSQADVVGQGGVNAGTATGGCFRSSLGSDGRIVARRADCTTAVEVDGDSGRVTMQRAQLRDTATAGGACTVEGDLALDGQPNLSTVVCRGGIWLRSGLPLVSPGTSCGGDEGHLGQTPQGVAYICRGSWQKLSDRITRSVLMQRWLVTEGTVVPWPTCGTAGTPAILLTPVDTVSDTAVTPPKNHYAAVAREVPGGWSMEIRSYDANLSWQHYGQRALAQVFCDFPN